MMVLDTTAQEFLQASCDLYGDDIAGCLDNGHVELRIKRYLRLPVAGCVGGNHLLNNSVDFATLRSGRLLGNLRTEIERDMKLMGACSVSDLGRDNLRFRS